MSLYVKDSAGNYMIASDDQVLAKALLVLDSVIRSGPLLDNPWAVKQYLMIRFARLEHEVFSLILLDTRHRVIDVEELFRGTINGAVVYPREVVKVALARNAVAVILVHNHPSGVPEPSQADEMLTRQLKAALALIDVRVLDHLIIGHNFVESFAERGLL